MCVERERVENTHLALLLLARFASLLELRLRGEVLEVLAVHPHALLEPHLVVGQQERFPLVFVEPFERLLGRDVLRGVVEGLPRRRLRRVGYFFGERPSDVVFSSAVLTGGSGGSMRSAV